MLVKHDGKEFHKCGPDLELNEMKIFYNLFSVG